MWWAIKTPEGVKKIYGNSVDTGDATYSNLAAMTDAERVSAGIYRLIEPSAMPSQFERSTGTDYVFDEEADTCWEVMLIEPLPLVEAQGKAIAQAKAEAAGRLQPSDWKIVRAAEGIKPCDRPTLDYRQAVRDASSAYEAAVLAAQSVADLAALEIFWPTL